MQRRFVSQVAQGLPHFREDQFRLIAQAEEGFGAAHLFARLRDFHNFVRRHGVRAGFARIAAESAVAAIVAAQVGQGDENFARIGDDAGLEALLECQAAARRAGSSSSGQRSSWQAPSRESGSPSLSSSRKVNEDCCVMSFSLTVKLASLANSAG